MADLLEDIRRTRTVADPRENRQRLYRGSRFATRHRVAMAAAAAVLITSAVVAPMVVSRRIRAAEEQHRARQVENMLGHLFELPNPRRMPRAPSAGDLVDHATNLVRRELDGSPPASRAC